jgi:hypothetical protein
MSVLTFIYGVIYLVPLVALAVVIVAHRRDVRPVKRADMAGAACLALVLVWLAQSVVNADVPLGCLWGS